MRENESSGLGLFNEETLGEFDYADNFSDLKLQDQLEVLRVWAWHNVDLKVAHQDYSGNNPMICVGNRPPGLKKHYLDLFEIDLDNQPEHGALEVGQ